MDAAKQAAPAVLAALGEGLKDDVQACIDDLDARVTEGEGYLAEVETLATAGDDAERAAKLAELDAEIAKLKAQRTKLASTGALDVQRIEGLASKAALRFLFPLDELAKTQTESLAENFYGNERRRLGELPILHAQSPAPHQAKLLFALWLPYEAKLLKEAEARLAAHNKQAWGLSAFKPQLLELDGLVAALRSRWSAAAAYLARHNNDQPAKPAA